MTQEERDISERQRKLIAEMNRAANRPRPVRVIPAADRDEEIFERLGFAVNRKQEAPDWAALTRG
jgi:hypothetical protein